MPTLYDYQRSVDTWMLRCFGERTSHDPVVRLRRFLDEAIALGRIAGLSLHDMRILVDYIYNEPVADLDNKVGEVMLMFTALCSALHRDLATDAEAELVRGWHNTFLLQSVIMQDNIDQPVGRKEADQ